MSPPATKSPFIKSVDKLFTYHNLSNEVLYVSLLHYSSRFTDHPLPLWPSPCCLETSPVFLVELMVEWCTLCFFLTGVLISAKKNNNWRFYNIWKFWMHLGSIHMIIVLNYHKQFCLYAMKQQKPCFVNCLLVLQLHTVLTFEKLVVRFCLRSSRSMPYKLWASIEPCDKCTE